MHAGGRQQKRWRVRAKTRVAWKWIVWVSCEPASLVRACVSCSTVRSAKVITCTTNMRTSDGGGGSGGGGGGSGGGGGGSGGGSGGGGGRNQQKAAADGRSRISRTAELHVCPILNSRDEVL